jgi:hypothetical protein
VIVAESPTFTLLTSKYIHTCGAATVKVVIWGGATQAPFMIPLEPEMALAVKVTADAGRPAKTHSEINTKNFK